MIASQPGALHCLAYGEMRRSNTIAYRASPYRSGGLVPCERFGPRKDWHALFRPAKPHKVTSDVAIAAQQLPDLTLAHRI